MLDPTDQVPDTTKRLGKHSKNNMIRRLPTFYNSGIYWLLYVVNYLLYIYHYFWCFRSTGYYKTMAQQICYLDCMVHSKNAEVNLIFFSGYYNNISLIVSITIIFDFFNFLNIWSLLCHYHGCLLWQII